MNYKYIPANLPYYSYYYEALKARIYCFLLHGIKIATLKFCALIRFTDVMETHPRNSTYH